MRYAVIVEEGENSFGAHVPDLPGCVAVADTKKEVVEDDLHRLAKTYQAITVTA